MAKQRDTIGFRELVYTVSGIVALFIICCTVLLAMGKDIQPILGVANLVVLPLLGLLGAKAYQTISGKVENVQEQVNGRMTTLIDHAKNSVPLDRIDKVETKP